jgi:hypothetical protein
MMRRDKIKIEMTVSGSALSVILVERQPTGPKIILKGQKHEMFLLTYYRRSYGVKGKNILRYCLL